MKKYHELIMILAAGVTIARERTRPPHCLLRECSWHLAKSSFTESERSSRLGTLWKPKHEPTDRGLRRFHIRTAVRDALIRPGIAHFDARTVAKTAADSLRAQIASGKVQVTSRI